MTAATAPDPPSDAAPDQIPQNVPGRGNGRPNEAAAALQPRTDHEFLEFVTRVSNLRRAHPVFRRPRFFEGRSIRGSGLFDIAWCRPDGTEMSDADWQTGYAKSLAVYLDDRGIAETDRAGRQVIDDSFLLLINAH